MKRKIVLQILLVIMICTAMFDTTAQVIKGVRVPQLTTQQRNSISDIDLNSAKGQVIYNLDNNCLEYWNSIKWVSLCLGSADITLEGNCDPNAPIPAIGTQTECKYTPIEHPACVVPSGQAYQVYLVAGSNYATLQVDELTSEFSLTFGPNNSSHDRIAVVRVVNNCSGEFKDFLFTQEGAECPSAINPPSVQVIPSTKLCAGGSTYAVVTNAQEGIDYVWEYGGVIVHTGKFMEIKRAGVYKVYKGLLGCGVGATATIVADDTLAPNSVIASASNSGMICGPSGKVILSTNISPIAPNTIFWFHNDQEYDWGRGTPISVTGQSNAGSWFAVQTTAYGCASSKSNTLNLTYNGTASSLPTPVVTINGQALSNAITICKNGTLELKINNTYPAGTMFEWFDNGVSIAKTTDPYYYTIAPNRNEMTISVEVSSSAGGCPVSSVSPKTNITMIAEPPTTINNGAHKATICGSGEATLVADNSSGSFYQWLWNGIAIENATAALYKTRTPGYYSVRYKDAAGCWSIISANILVEANAAIALNWIGTPDTVEVFPNDRTYSVVALPAAESYTWSSSNTTVATVTPIGNGQSATVNYKIAGNVTITVTATDNGCGSPSLSLPVRVTAGCSPMLSLTLIPSGTPSINKYIKANGTPQNMSDGCTEFSVTANGGATPTSYQWYVNDTLQPNATSSTFKYMTPTTTPMGIVNKVVKVTVKNNCTPDSGDAGISEQATVNVIKFATEDGSGHFRLTGKTCFDIAQSNDGGICAPLSSRINDFPNGSPSQTYTFAPTGSYNYSNLSFIIQDPNGLVASSTSSIANGTTTNPSTLTIVFNKAAVMTKALGKDKTTALNITIIAMYKDISNTYKQISLTLSIQDCSCGCTVKKSGGGYLTFMCYNLGANEATKTKTPQEQANTFSPIGQTTNSDIYGDLYQWGRKKDGHEKRGSQTYTHGTGNGPIPIGFDEFSQIPSTSIATDRFVCAPSAPYDWHGNSSSSFNNNLWNFTQYPSNNPCPAGWRIPTQNEWNSIVQNGNTVTSIPSGGQNTSSGNYWKWNPATPITTAGWLVSPDGGVTYTLFLPAGGRRDGGNGSLSDAGTSSIYWSTSPGETLLMNGSSIGPGGPYSRAIGYSVRCVLDE